MENSYCLQNNGLIKIKGEINYEKLHYFKTGSLEGKYLFNFCTHLMNVREVSGSSKGKNSDQKDFQRAETLTQFRGKVIKEIFFYIICKLIPEK